MDVASDGLKPVEASKLRLVKDVRERSVLRELSNIDDKRRIAFEAVERASSDLASAEKHRASVEDQLYQEMASLGAMSVTELDRRCHRVIGRLTAEIASRREALEQARIAQEQAQTRRLLRPVLSGPSVRRRATNGDRSSAMFSARLTLVWSSRPKSKRTMISCSRIKVLHIAKR
ncbi:hypothetical protein ACVW0J_000053 [Bradyrhizobium sp. i1.7.7]